MSGSTALLVVLSIVGYLLLRHGCHRTRFRWDALEWQQNLFESTAVGLGLFASVRLASPLATALATRTGVPLAPAKTMLNTYLPLPFARSVIGALALGWVSPSSSTVVGIEIGRLRWPSIGTAGACAFCSTTRCSRSGP